MTAESVDPGTGDRAQDGVDHLQAAAREMIEAARAFLDVLEELVGDEERVAEAAQAVGLIAKVATRVSGSGNERPREGSGGDHVEQIKVL